MSEITGTAQALRGAVAVEVHPGGALRSLTLTDHALAAGPRELADAILNAVARATALANRRTMLALGDALPGLGMHIDAEFTEQIEATTPETWRLA